MTVRRMLDVGFGGGIGGNMGERCCCSVSPERVCSGGYLVVSGRIGIVGRVVVVVVGCHAGLMGSPSDEQQGWLFFSSCSSRTVQEMKDRSSQCFR